MSEHRLIFERDLLPASMVIVAKTQGEGMIWWEDHVYLLGSDMVDFWCITAQTYFRYTDMMHKDKIPQDYERRFYLVFLKGWTDTVPINRSEIRKRLEHETERRNSTSSVQPRAHSVVHKGETFEVKF